MTFVRPHVHPFSSSSEPCLDILKPMRTSSLRPIVALTLTLLTPFSSFGWGSEGHRMINRLAARTLPADVPAFLRSDAAVSEIEYLGPEQIGRAHV